MEWLIVLNYTSGVVDIMPCPEFDEDDVDYLQIFLDNKYDKCHIHWMVSSSINLTTDTDK